LGDLGEAPGGQLLRNAQYQAFGRLAPMPEWLWLPTQTSSGQVSVGNEKRADRACPVSCIYQKIGSGSVVREARNAIDVHLKV
jgi:hypothetical protein